jgi:hypothetical protein
MASAKMKVPSWLCTAYDAGSSSSKLNEILANITVLPYLLIMHQASRLYSRR